MRTGRTLTVFQSLLFPGGGVSGPGGVYLPGPGGVPAWSRGGVPAWSGGVYLVLGECTCLVWSWGSVPAWGECTCLGGCLVPEGVYLPGLGGRGGVPAWSGGGLGGVPARGGVWSRGGVPAWSGTPPPVDRMTHACENITLAKTSFRPVTIRATNL